MFFSDLNEATEYCTHDLVPRHTKKLFRPTLVYCMYISMRYNICSLLYTVKYEKMRRTRGGGEGGIKVI